MGETNTNTLEKLKIRKDSGDGYVEYNSFIDVEARNILDNNVLRLDRINGDSVIRAAREALGLTTLPAGPAGSSVVVSAMPKAENDYTLAIKTVTPGKQTDDEVIYVSEPIPAIVDAAVEDDYLVLTLNTKDADGQYIKKTIGPVRGLQGEQGTPGNDGMPGIGILNIALDSGTSHIVWTDTNGGQHDAGTVRSIVGINYNEQNGALTVTYTDKDSVTNLNKYDTFTINSITNTTYDEDTGELRFKYNAKESDIFSLNSITGASYDEKNGKLKFTYNAKDPDIFSINSVTGATYDEKTGKLKFTYNAKTADTFTVNSIIGVEFDETTDELTISYSTGKLSFYVNGISKTAFDRQTGKLTLSFSDPTVADEIITLNYIESVNYTADDGTLTFKFTDMDPKTIKVNCITSTTFDQKTGQLRFDYSASDPKFFTLPYPRKVEIDNKTGHLMVTYAGDTTATDLGKVVPKEITKAEVTADGDLILTYSDGDHVNVGNVIGANQPLVEGLLRLFNADFNSINLLDETKVEETEDRSDGPESFPNILYTTDYIVASAGNRYTVQSTYSDSNTSPFQLVPIAKIEQFDIYKNLLSSTSYKLQDNQTIIEITEPTCAYMRVTYIRDAWKPYFYNIMLVRGEAIQEQYVPYAEPTYLLQDVSILSDNVVKSVQQELSEEQQATARTNIKASTSIIIDLTGDVEYRALDIYNTVLAGNTVLAKISKNDTELYIPLASVCSEFAKFVDYSDTGAANVYEITNNEV